MSSIYVLKESCTLANVAKLANVPFEALWFPITSFSKSAAAFISVERHCPIVLRLHNHAGRTTGNTEGDDDQPSLIVDRSQMMTFLKILGNVEHFRISEKTLQSNLGRCTLYVHAASSGQRASVARRKIESGTEMLLRRITPEEAVAEGSAAGLPLRQEEIALLEGSNSGNKRDRSGLHLVTQRASATASVVSATPTVMSAIAQELDVADADDERNVDAEIRQFCQRSPQADLVAELMAHVKTRIRSQPLELPLHNASLSKLKGKNTPLNTFYVNGKMFTRTNAFVLSHQHVPASVTAAAKARVLSASRLVACVLIEGACITTDPLIPGPSAWSLKHPLLPERLSQLAERGYRLVLLAHYPSLHHGNDETLKERCGRVTAFLDQHLHDVPCLVLFSMQSYFSRGVESMDKPSVNAFRSPKELPFCFPNVGLYNVFLHQFNSSMEPDRDRALMIGGGHDNDQTKRPANGTQESEAEGVEEEREDRMSAIYNEMEKLFAARCGAKQNIPSPFRFVTLAELVRPLA